MYKYMAMIHCKLKLRFALLTIITSHQAKGLKTCWSSIQSVLGVLQLQNFLKIKPCEHVFEKEIMAGDLSVIHAH